MAFARYIFFLLLVSESLSQRPSYAGSRPIGYPALDETTAAPTTAASTTAAPTTVASRSNNNLNNRFGNSRRTTTERLPLGALGDRKLLERLFKLPLDKQPFWLLNWRALDDDRNQPRTYPLRTNSYID